MSRNWLDLGERDDLVELAVDLGLRHAEDRAVEVDVLAAGQLGVKAGADLQQRGDPAAEPDAPVGRLGDPAEDLQQRPLAAPLRPMMPTTSPGRTSNETSRSAQNVLGRRVRPRRPQRRRQGAPRRPRAKRLAQRSGWAPAFRPIR